MYRIQPLVSNPLIPRVINKLFVFILTIISLPRFILRTNREWNRQDDMLYKRLLDYFPIMLYSLKEYKCWSHSMYTLMSTNMTRYDLRREIWWNISNQAIQEQTEVYAAINIMFSHCGNAKCRIVFYPRYYVTNPSVHTYSIIWDARKQT